MKRISVVTGTRAEYGLLSNLLKLINKDKNFNLQLIVTGTHLSKKFGKTFREIEKDKILISKKINILDKKDDENSVINSTSKVIKKIGHTLKKFSPEALILIGDRYEILGSAIAANFLRIPIFHFHGGERSEGAVDEAIRHAVTKMSAYHFVANDVYRKRVIQLGENPSRVFNVGGMGVDALKKVKKIKKKLLEKKLKIKFKKKIFLITYHPVTLEDGTSKSQIKNLLGALSEFKDTSLIFTSPNSDTNHEVIFKEIQKFIKKKKDSFFFKSLGKEKYFSLLNIANLVIGNSSSGILEVPYFKIPTINIGDRQNGRLKARSIIDCKPLKKAIINSIHIALSNKLKKICKNNSYFYGQSGSSYRAFRIIKKIIKNTDIKKKFYDVKFKI